MAPRSFGNKYNGSQWRLITRGNERGHTDGGIKVEAGAVNKRLPESCSDAPAGKKQRNKHGAYAARSEGKKRRGELQHTKSEELRSAVVRAQDVRHRLVVRADRYEITRVDMQEKQTAKSRQ